MAKTFGRSANSMAGSSDNMENVRDIGATSGARYSNATDRQKLGFGWPKPCIRTASLRTGVSVSGKRNFGRRDKGDETSGEVHRDSPAETQLTPQLGQLRASYRTAGKSLRKSECVVETKGLELRAKHAVLGRTGLWAVRCFRNREATIYRHLCANLVFLV